MGRQQKPVFEAKTELQIPEEWKTLAKTPQEAQSRGDGKFFDGNICNIGKHYSLKYQSNGAAKGCVTCQQLKQRAKTRKERQIRGEKADGYDLDDFIKEAKEIHGEGRYSYELIKSFRHKTDEYWIICPNCCCFKQKATKHLSGQGCNKCNLRDGMAERRITQEEFIKRCIAQHGDKYDYSAINYTTMHELITPICLNYGHGIFETEANNFQRGLSGCQRCAAISTSQRCRRTRQEFIDKAREVHKDSYNYDLVNYRTDKEKVLIHCKLGHGVFEQTPGSHLSGSGCPRCAELKRAEIHAMTMKDFLTKARQKHGSKYDYSKVNLGKLCGEKSRGHTKVEIICPTHGSFWQAPLVHFKSGCRQCHMDYLQNEVLAIGAEEWKRICTEVHKSKYNYSQIEHFDKVLDNVVSIICKKHGMFKQSARSHMAGRGCQTCGDLNRGRDSYRNFLRSKKWALFPTEIYFVEVRNMFFKFGISADFEDRARGDYTETYFRQELTRAEAWSIEQYLLLSTAWASPTNLPSDLQDWGGKNELRNKEFDPREMSDQIASLVDRVDEEGWKKFFDEHVGACERAEEIKHKI